jgi:hypothetical protein
MRHLLLLSLALFHFEPVSVTDPLAARRQRLISSLVETSREIRAATKLFDPSVDRDLERGADGLLIQARLLRPRATPSNRAVRSALLNQAAQAQWLDRVERLSGDYRDLAAAIRRLDGRSLGSVVGSSRALVRAFQQFRRPDTRPFVSSVRTDGARVPAVLGWKPGIRILVLGDHLGDLRKQAHIKLDGDPKFAVMELRVRERSDTAWEVELAEERTPAYAVVCGVVVLGEQGEGPGQTRYPVCLASNEPARSIPELRMRYERRDSVLYTLDARELKLESQACDSATARTETLNWELPFGGYLASVETQPMETRGVSSLEPTIVDSTAGVVSVTARLNPSKCVPVGGTRRPLYSSLWYGYIRPVVVKPSLSSEVQTLTLEPIGGDTAFVSTKCNPARKGFILREIQTVVRLVGTDRAPPVATIEGVVVDARKMTAISQQVLGGLEVTFTAASESRVVIQEFCVIARPAAAPG